MSLLKYEFILLRKIIDVLMFASDEHSRLTEFYY